MATSNGGRPVPIEPIARFADAPHHGVLARLGPSKIAGVGVFAITDIPCGVNIFSNDRAEIKWIDASILDAAALTTEHRKLYNDFAIRRGDKIGCPANFNQLAVGWYVNEPVEGDEPNLTATADYEFISCRPIAAGEELTVLYKSFSDGEEQPLIGSRDENF